MKVKVVHKLLIVDLLVIIIGLLLMFIQPFGWDITIGLIILSIGFILSVVLFVVKLKITAKNE